MKRSIIFLSICCLLGSCSYINDKLGLADDNVIEESAEAVLEENTGLDLDFTPDSQEE